MKKLKVVAGDFGKSPGEVCSDHIRIWSDQHWFRGERISYTDFKSIEVANEENVTKFGSAAGWGAAGAVVLGPVGFLAGALLGGKGKEITFIAELKNGKKFMATTENKYFKIIQAGVFR